MLVRLSVLALLVIACRTPSPEPESAVLANTGNGDMDRYEATRVIGLSPTADIAMFAPKQGFKVRRDGRGNAVSGTLTVLADNPADEVHVVGFGGNWNPGPQNKCQRLPGNDRLYVECPILVLRHGDQYRLLVNGEQMIDPAAAMYTKHTDRYFNSIFWDFDRPGGYRLRHKVADLRTKPVIIAETEVFEMVRSFGRGPPNRESTYRYVVESGVIRELAKAGYNAVEFVPFNASLDGDAWKYRYQVFGLFAPDSRYGTPDEFAKMVDSFNEAGIQVIMDAVIGHYPYRCESGGPCSIDIGRAGLHKWRAENSNFPLYGSRHSPWGTYRYHYENPRVARFLIDSILFMMQRYGIGGVRFDNYDGIRFEPGGTPFLTELAREVRKYRPEAVLIAEMFFGDNNVMKRLDQGGYGINFRTHSDYFDFIKDNMLRDSGGIDMGVLVAAMRNPWNWGEAARVSYITNHDEAANTRNGATGKYVASLILGEDENAFRTNPIAAPEPWKYANRKTKAFGALAMLASSVYLDMPQKRLMQRGTFYTNPAIDWGQRGLVNEQGRVWTFFGDLSRYVLSNEAFSWPSMHPNIENHVDHKNQIISLYRRGGNRQVYVLVNLSKNALHQAPYRFGVHQGGAYRLVIDSDSRRYTGDSNTHFGTGALEARLGGNSIMADCRQPEHGKPCSVALPYVGEYSAVVLEKI